jgi:hypothetical protein
MDDLLAHVARRGPLEHLCLLLSLLPRSAAPLSMRKLGNKGASRLGEALTVNATLTELGLGGNQLTDAAALALAGLLKVNATLTELSLRSNQIGDAGAIGLGKALEVNTLMKTLIRANLEP